MFSITSMQYNVVPVLMTRIVVHGKSVGSLPRPPHVAIPRRRWRTLKLKVFPHPCTWSDDRPSSSTVWPSPPKKVSLRTLLVASYSTNNNALVIRGRARHCLDSLVSVSQQREICDYVGHALRSSSTRYLGLENRILELKTRYSMISKPFGDCCPLARVQSKREVIPIGSLWYCGFQYTQGVLYFMVNCLVMATRRPECTFQRAVCATESDKIYLLFYASDSRH